MGLPVLDHERVCVTNEPDIRSSSDLRTTQSADLFGVWEPIAYVGYDNLLIESRRLQEAEVAISER